MEKLIAAIVVTSVSALTIVAYKHPKAYAKLCGAIYFTSAAIFAVIGTWNTALDYAGTKLSPYIIKKQMEAATAHLHEYIVPWWAFVLLAIWMFYLLFLTNLPHLLKEDQAEK